MKVQKLALWLDQFIQSIQIFKWKSTEELCLMKLKSDAKFEEKLTLGPKNDMKNLVNFNVSSSKSGNLHFDVLLLAISIWSFSLKSTEEWSLVALKKDLNFEEKVTFYWHEEISEPNLSSGKVWKFALKRCRGVVLWKMTYDFL